MTEARTSVAEVQNAALLGIGLMLASVFLFSMNNALGKWVISLLPIGQFMFLRSIIVLTVLSPFFWRGGLAQITGLPRKGLHLFRAGLAAIEVAMFYWTLAYLPLADAMTFWMAVPIYVTVLSAILLGEKIGWRRWLAVAVGFCGVLLVIRPSGATVSWPALIGLTGGILYGGVLVATRALRSAPDTILMGGQFFGALIFGLASIPFGWVAPTSLDLSLIAIITTFSIIGNLCANRSLRLAPASVVIPYKYTMIIWALMFGYLLFNEVPDAITILGAAIVIAAGFYIFLREQAVARQSAAATP